MKYTIPRRSIGLAIASILLVIVGVFFYGHFLRKGVTHSFNQEQFLSGLHVAPDGPSANIRKAMDSIIHAGGFNALVSVIKTAENRNIISDDDCHSLMHLVGHKSYLYFAGDAERMLAVSEGRECIGGYLHGIEGQMTITSRTPIKDLEDFCSFLVRKGIKTRTCYHGAGHAAMEATRHNVKQSLSFCDALQDGPEKDLTDCYRGVFSETGNLALGTDGHTGLPIQPVVFPGLTVTSPHLYCNSFTERYRDSCYSQMTKFLYSGDIVSSFLKCTQAVYTNVIQKICITTLAGMYARAQLSSQDHLVMPPVVYTFSQDLQKASIAGAKDSFVGYSESKVIKDWRPFCNAYPNRTVREYCLETFRDFALSY